MADPADSGDDRVVAGFWIPVTPNDSADILGGRKTVAIKVVTAGNVEFVDGNGTEIMAFTDFETLPMQVTRIRAASTTAVDIWACF